MHIENSIPGCKRANKLKITLDKQVKNGYNIGIDNGSDAEEYPKKRFIREQSRRLKALQRRNGEGRRGAGPLQRQR